jgi:hypothetical protein
VLDAVAVRSGVVAAGDGEGDEGAEQRNEHRQRERGGA